MSLQECRSNGWELLSLARRYVRVKFGQTDRMTASLTLRLPHSADVGNVNFSTELRPLRDVRHQGRGAKHRLGAARGRRAELPEYVSEVWPFGTSGSSPHFRSMTTFPPATEETRDEVLAGGRRRGRPERRAPQGAKRIEAE